MYLKENGQMESFCAWFWNTSTAGQKYHQELLILKTENFHRIKF